MLLSTFLVDNIDEWLYDADVYISQLKEVDNIVFKALIKKLLPNIENQDIPTFKTVEEFIIYWVDNRGLFSGIQNPQISEKTFLRWVQEKKPLNLCRIINNPNMTQEGIIKIWNEFDEADREMAIRSYKLSPETKSKLVEEYGQRINNNPGFRPFQNLESNSALNISISEETFKKLVQEGKPVNWNELCVNRAISGETFDQWVQEGKPVNWHKLSKNNMIPEEIFLKWIQEGRPIDWSALSKNTRISSETFDKLAEEGKPLDWYKLSNNLNVSEEFLRKWSRRGKSLDWDGLCTKGDLSEEAFLEWESESRPLNFLELFNHHDISERTISRWIKEEKYSISYRGEDYCPHEDSDERKLQKYLSGNPNLSVKFFSEHIHRIDWSILLKNNFYRQKEIEQEYKKAVKIIEKHYFRPLKYVASLIKN